MKMKVNVAKLCAAIIKHQEDDEKRFAREQEKYDEAKEFNRKKHIENVAAYLASLKDGGKDLSSYDLTNRLHRGEKSESAPHKVADYGDLLVKLRLCETPLVTVDDKSEYMRFLSGKCVC